MTPETREALKEFAQGVKFMAGRQAVDSPADFEFYRDLIVCAERLYLALEQEPETRKPVNGDQRVDLPEINYETWRDEQMDTLRKLFRQRGVSPFVGIRRRSLPLDSKTWI